MISVLLQQAYSLRTAEDAILQEGQEYSFPDGTSHTTWHLIDG